MEVTIGCTVGYEERPGAAGSAVVGAGAGVGAAAGAGEGQRAAPDMSAFDMDDPRQLGMMGEELAAFYMEENGYTVCERNYRTPHGEADMICRKGDEIVLVEVKTRRGDGAYPEEAVDRRKVRRYRGITLDYLNDELWSEFVRFDVIAMNVVGPHCARLRHYVGVCSWEG